jgi:glucans biosynthesis protein C
MMNSALYLPFFLFGCFCFLRKDLMDNHFISGKLWIIIPLAVLMSTLLFLDAKLSAFGLLIEIAYRWTFMFLIINIVKATLNYSNRFLKYIADASYPFYILHQPIIVVIGYFYVKDMFFNSILLNYIFMVIVCISLTYLVYELAIRRNKIGTILFTGVFPNSKK